MKIFREGATARPKASNSLKVLRKRYAIAKPKVSKTLKILRKECRCKAQGIKIIEDP